MSEAASATRALPPSPRACVVRGRSGAAVGVQLRARAASAARAQARAMLSSRSAAGAASVAAQPQPHARPSPRSLAPPARTSRTAAAAALPAQRAQLARPRSRAAQPTHASSSASSAAVAPATGDVASLKLRLLRVAATSDRGQLHNAFVWGADAYAAERAHAAALVAALEAHPSHGALAPLDPSALDGTWELTYASGQLFRSSPFFLAVSEAFGDSAKSELFFKLHELQVASFGISRYGRVEQSIDSAAGELTSSFTTLLFGLTVLPLIGWGKLLPTFGGRIVSIARVLRAAPSSDAREIRVELEKTRVEQAPGIALMPLLGRFLVGREAPVGAVWRLLPWNGGRAPTCAVRCTFLDGDTRVMRDRDGAFFVYMRCEAEAA
jgi:hypothetical protein